MASQAEIDLVVNASNTLNRLENDLDRVVRAAQADANPVTIAAVMDQQSSVAAVLRDVDRVVAAAQAGAPDIDLDAALNQQASLRQVQRQLNQLVDEAEAGQVSRITLRAALNVPRTLSTVSRDLRTVVNRAEAAAPDVDVPVRFNVDEDSFRRFDVSLRSVAGTAGRALRPVLLLGAGVAALGAAAGAAAPLLAGVVAAAQQLAPAAAVATQGILAMQLASGTLKLALSGVEEALTTAFDPEAKPEDLEKALKRLAPEARNFVRALADMRGGFNRLRLQTQNLFFRDLDGLLEGLGRRAFPVVRDAVRNTAIVFNRMAAGVLNAAGELAENGTLRQALTGTVRGLRNLENVPGRLVTAFGQISAAAAPAFARLTQIIDRVSQRFAERIDRGFKSGELTKRIDQAVTEFGKLFRAVGNVGAAFRNVFSAVQGDGGSLFTILEDITQRFEDLTGSQGFQDTLGALSRVMQEIGKEIGPLLLNIFEELGPVFQRLEGPVTRIVNLLGDELNKTVDELGPVLVTVADTFDKLVADLEPFVELIFEIARAALPQVQRAFEFVGFVLEELRPGIERITEAAGPLIEKLFEISALIGDKLFDALESVLGPIIKFQNTMLSGIATIIEEFVVPALEIMIDVLNGDFNEAGEKAILLGAKIKIFVARAFEALKNEVSAHVRAMRTRIITEFNQALLEARAAVSRKLSEIINFFVALPGRIQAAVGNMGLVLFNEGEALVNGLIAGVRARAATLIIELNNLAARARDTVAGALGIASPSKVFAELGDNMIQGLQLGIERSAQGLKDDLTGLAVSLPLAVAGGGSMALPDRQQLAPEVTVFIGNQALDRRTDMRIQTAFKRRDTVASQGVRR